MAPDPYRQHAAPMRWADMDLLGHVNNVRYLDYLTEARVALLLEHGVDPAAVRLASHRIGFVSPMVFGRAPAQVRAWLVQEEAGSQSDAQSGVRSGAGSGAGPDPGGDEGREQLLGSTTVRVAQEVSTGPSRDAPEGVVHLRTETHLEVAEGAAQILADVSRAPGHEWRAVHAALDDPGGVRHRYPVTLRERDLGRDGAARDDAVLELFQESRIRYFMDLHTRGEEWSQHVVARTDVALLGPVRPGPSLEVRSWIAHVGSSSFVVRSDLCGRASDEVVARSLVVMVGFDPQTQAPAPMREQQRARLTRELT